MFTYEILSTEPSLYQAPDKTVVNGVLVRFRIDPINEYHSLNIPRMDAELAHAEVKKYVKQREALAVPPEAE